MRGNSDVGLMRGAFSNYTKNIFENGTSEANSSTPSNRGNKFGTLIGN